MIGDLTPSIPDLVEYQLPEHARGVENERFITFLKHYYDWLTQNGQPTDFIHNILQYRDIDLTNEAFRLRLTKSLLDAVPAYSQADRTLLAKHIVEFLRSKGNYESFQFIMNAIYGEDIQMVWNSEKLFRPSANEYHRTASLVIESTDPWSNVEGSEIVQTHPMPASGVIESCVTTTHDGVQLNWLKLDDKTVVGRFVPEGTVETLHNNIDRSWYREEEYYKPLSFTNNTLVFLAEKEEARPYENLFIGQIGSNFKATVASFVSRYNETGRTRVTLTLKDVTGTFTNGNDIYIYAPALFGSIYTKADFETGKVSKSVVDVAVDNAGSLYTPGDRITFIGGSGINVDGFVSEVTSGGIDSVNILRKGYGYSVGDSLNVIAEDSGGTGASIKVSHIDGIDGTIDVVSELNAATIVEGGSGYAVNDEVEIIGGVRAPGTPHARLKVTAVSSTWLFKGVRVTRAGVGYPLYTKIALVDTGTFTAVAGFAATPVFNRSRGIAAVRVTSIPTISTAALAVVANGYGATATANLSGGSLISTTMVTNGVNYVDPVAYIFGDGTGAVVNCTMSSGTITSVNVVKPGAGYTTATVVIRERLGSGFVAVPLIQNQTGSLGTISAFTILERGQYLELPPCHSVAVESKIGTGTGALLSIDFRLLSAVIDNPGHYYQQVDVSVNGNGSGANLVPNIHDGVIASFTKVNGGSGYTYAYVFVADGVGFIGKANIVAGAVDSITITNGGYGFAGASVVTIMGDGTGADYNIAGVGNVKNGVLTDVVVLSGGSGYYHGTTVTCTPSSGGSIAATLIPTIVDGVIKSVSSNGGEGYIQADLAGLTINAGTVPSITGTVSGNGKIAGFSIVNGGYGYWSQSEVTPLSITTAVAGSGAKFLPVLNSNGEFVRVDVLEGGSGYTNSSTMSVSGGGGTGVSLSPVVFGGRVTDVNIVSPGYGYKYGTYAVLVGDGLNGDVTPVIETGITSADVIAGGSDYTDATVINITDASGTGAEIRPIIVNGVIVDLNIVKKGSGYVNPSIAATDVGGGSGSSLVAQAKRFITDVTVTNPGSGYTYADVVVVGDGFEGDVSLAFEKLGSIDTITLVNAGTGLTTTPVVTIADNSGYGAVSGVMIYDNGAGYSKLPVITMDDKYDEFNVLTATGTRFTCFGSKIGGVRRVMFDNHGAHYNDSPTPVFLITAQLAENSAFKVGETVTIKSGTYRDVAVTSYLLLETGDRLLLENGDFLTLDADESFADSGVTGTIVDFDFDRNVIKILSSSDIFYVASENDSFIETEDERLIINEMSGSFDVGDVILGSKSGGHATIERLNRANGRSIIGGNGWSAFEFLDQTGMLNDKLSVIADNQKYQDYAYVIKAGRALQDYEQLLKDTVHPAGFSMFGEVVTQTFSELSVLNEIGYNELLSIVYILSVSAIYQADTQWSGIGEIFGDFTKFNFVDVPISLVKDRSIHSTSPVVFKNYDEYVAPPMFSTDISKWTVSNNAQLTINSGTGPDGALSLDRVADTSSALWSWFYMTFSGTAGKTYAFETFVKKQVNPQTYPMFRLRRGTTSNYTEVSLNTETGSYTTAGSASTVEVIEVGDYWFVRVIMTNTVTSSTIYAQIYPATGFISNMGSHKANATGSIEMARPVVKDVTGVSTTPGILRSVNSQYSPLNMLLLSTEASINIQ